MADILLPALAADAGSLMAQFLQALGSSNRQIAEQAVGVMQRLTEAADADDLLSAVIAADNGVKLLCQALIDRHGLTPPYSADVISQVPYSCSARSEKPAEAWHAHYLSKSPVAQVLLDVCSRASSELRHSLVWECAALVSSSSQQPGSNCSKGAALLLTLICRGTDNESTLLEDVDEPLLVGARERGPSQVQYLAALLALIEQPSHRGSKQYLVHCGLETIIIVMQQQDQAADLAASLIAGLRHTYEPKSREYTGRKAILAHINQLAEALDSSNSIWVRTCAVWAMCEVVAETPGLKAVGAAIPHMDAILAAAAAVTVAALEHVPAQKAPPAQMYTLVRLSVLQFLQCVVESTGGAAAMLEVQQRVQLLSQMLGEVSTALQPLYDGYIWTYQVELLKPLTRIAVALVGQQTGVELVATSMGTGLFSYALTSHLRYLENQPAALPPDREALEIVQPALCALAAVLQFAADQPCTPAAAIPAPEFAALLEEHCSFHWVLAEVLCRALKLPILAVQASECLRKLSLLSWGAYQCSKEIEVGVVTGYMCSI